MPTICNSSPLILYARIGRLELIHQLVGELVVPSAVYDEIVVAGAGRPGAAAVSAASWIQTRPVRDRDVVEQLLEQVDPGEAEAIALGLESSGRVVILMDDRRGRRLADERNFQVVGSAGLLILAKQQALISLVKPLLDELRAAGLRLSDWTYRRVLADAGESPDDVVGVKR